jgi:tetratricopeptide (TPR) repeat protein
MRHVTTSAKWLAMCLLACTAARAAGQGARDASQLPAGAEAWSLSGTPLTPLPLADAARQALGANLAKANADLAAAPGNADAMIWVGRRLGYLGRYRDAIDAFSRGIAAHPTDARMYRHRGHRFITTRQFDRAIADLSKAATLVAGRPDEVEPDGQPNARNIPTSTLQSNIHYHLGLAYYLVGNFEQARASYVRCLDVARNDDMQVATRYWLYMTLRRMGRNEEATAALASIATTMNIIENASYHSLLLVARGELDGDALLAKAEPGLDRVTIGYGVGNWHLYNGRRDRAMAVFRDVVAANNWAPFGAIAAEAELFRMNAVPAAR